MNSIDHPTFFESFEMCLFIDDRRHVFGCRGVEYRVQPVIHKDFMALCVELAFNSFGKTYFLTSLLCGRNPKNFRSSFHQFWKFETMSLKWLQQKLLKSKVFDEFEQKQLDIKNDYAVPRLLRESLISEDSRESSLNISSTSIEAVNGDSVAAEIEFAGNFSDEEDDFEVARTCSEYCNHKNCSFQPRLTSASEIFISTRVQFSQSSMSLVRKVSSMSILETTTDNQNDFLEITRVVPLRNNSVIVHWSVKSFKGLRGYKVKFLSFSFVSNLPSFIIFRFTSTAN